MTWEAWLTLAIIAVMTVCLVRNLIGPGSATMGALCALMVAGLFSPRFPTPQELVAGFGNPGVITIGILYIVAAGLTQTGAMSLLISPVLGQPRSVRTAQFRMMLPVSVLSAFLNNTPIVAIFMPVVNDWAKRIGIRPSKLLLPLSYAAIVGGMCTLIGTSTNVVVYVLLDDATQAQLGMFTLGAVGVPVALLGLAYVLIASSKLLPDRGAPSADLRDARQYTIEMFVDPAGPIAGRTIQQAGLRRLPGCYLAEIARDDERLVAVGPEQILRGDDRLIFVGIVESAVDLQRIRGLIPAGDQVFKLQDPRPDRCLVEAVVSEACPLVGRSIREGRFRGAYDAVVIAVHRGGERVSMKIGDIVLHPGDTLLIETHPRFLDQQRNRRDFYLVSEVADSKPIRYERAWMALAILGALVVTVATGLLPLLVAAMLAAALMILTRCLATGEARNAIEWRVLMVVGATIGIGRTVEASGLAGGIAELVLAAAAPLGIIGVLLGIYIVTMVCTELISNVGAAVLVLPIATAAANAQQAPLLPFVIAILIAASASFATPFGYQTNLMVYGPGGYKYTDYLKFGLPLSLLTMTLAVTLIPMIWELQ